MKDFNKLIKSLSKLSNKSGTRRKKGNKRFAPSRGLVRRRGI